MEHSNDLETSLTLLHRLRGSPSDDSAWNLFVARYGDRIRRWCRMWGLEAADAEDVTQNVLLELSKQMQKSSYTPPNKFRAWLKTVAHHAWYDYQHRRRRLDTGSGNSAVLELLQSVAAHDSFLDNLDEECERQLYEAAKENVRQRVTPKTWQVFVWLTIDGLSGEETSNRANMTVGAVHVASCRVRKLLKEEVERLDRNEG